MKTSLSYAKSHKMKEHIKYPSFKVAGTFYRLKTVREFLSAGCKGVEIIHEPMAKYPHALAVYGLWDNPSESTCNIFRKALIGYVPDVLAKRIWYGATSASEWSEDYAFAATIEGIDTIKNNLSVSMKLLTTDGDRPLAHNIKECESSCGDMCPMCEAFAVFPILYGAPDETAIRLAEKGELILGGCPPRKEDRRCICCEFEYCSEDEPTPRSWNESDILFD